MMRTETTVEEHAERISREAKRLKIQMQIKNAKLLTAASCCLFAPCTVPYICVKKREEERIDSAPARQSMI